VYVVIIQFIYKSCDRDVGVVRVGGGVCLMVGSVCAMREGEGIVLIVSVVVA
jgi:hypothetical protein